MVAFCASRFLHLFFDCVCSSNLQNKRCLLIVHLVLKLCNALRCAAALCFAAPCYALPCYALPCYALPCYALPCYALPCYALPCYALMETALVLIFLYAYFDALNR